MTNKNSKQNSMDNGLLNPLSGTASNIYIGDYLNNSPNYIGYNNIWQTPHYQTYISQDLIFKFPETYITVNGNRKKNNNGKIYLKDGEEYQFEFFNPNTYNLGILISIDDKLISQSHLVIKPGQRIHLDRFIDESKKFLYKTYNVESNNSIVDDAIKSNGLINVTYYKENTQSCSNINGVTNLNYGTSTYHTNNIIGTYNNALYNNTTNNLNNSITNFKETGTTEKGSISNRKFDSIIINFDFNSVFIFDCVLLPISMKPLETKDLIQHCTNCGTKYDKKDNFCRKCGTKK